MRRCRSSNSEKRAVVAGTRASAPAGSAASSPPTRPTQTLADKGRVSVGEAGVRTVAHGVQPWVTELCIICEPAFAGDRKLFFRALKRAPNSARPDFPRLEAGGYGSYAGFADDGSSATPHSSIVIVSTRSPRSV